MGVVAVRPETTAEPMTSTRRQQAMTSLFLLMTFCLRGTVGRVDASRQNDVISDDNDTGMT